MAQMTPAGFAMKWRDSTNTERAASQEHFIDLCRMLEVSTPNEADPGGEWYAFEKGVEKTGGGDGWADVWKRGQFAWEYKGKRKDLEAAYKQLLLYREALENPPLLVVCDLDRFEIHTNFTNTVKTIHSFALDDLLNEPKEPLRVLRAVMANADELRPSRTREELTELAARQFASLAEALHTQGNEPLRVAHFLNKLLFCLFAEDAGLLPGGIIKRLIDGAQKDSDAFASGLADLFGKMSKGGGLFGPERISWFNGGLFDGDDVVALDSDQLSIVRAVSDLDWSQVEPAIFGTLFERGLDPGKRSQLGAHYTDRRSIARLIDPVVIAPLREEYEAMQARVLELLAEGRRISGRTSPDNNPNTVFHAFLDRLRDFRVLDPACGSGNFLYVALQDLKDLEREAILWGSQTLRAPLAFPQVGPQVVHGIELNTYAAELARVVIWIGEIQWMLSNGFAYLRDPILRPLQNIECRDAILAVADDGEPTESEWPRADAIVGNPPYIGGKLMRANLGRAYVDSLFKVYDGRVPREADLVCYWFEKAREMIANGKVQRAGLLGTQGIRGGASRKVLERILETGNIFMAWSDQPWVVEGAAVHVSIVGFDNGTQTNRVLNGVDVSGINPDLTTGLDLTKAVRLAENLDIAFMGDTKGGTFDISYDVAQEMLSQPNPDGRLNADVVRPWVNAIDLTGRTKNMWIVDFGDNMSIEQAALYEAPFSYVERVVKPERAETAYGERWWLHLRPRSNMRAAVRFLDRYIITPRVSKHRVFVWRPTATLADSATFVFARDDDYFFGVLHSRPHELWARGTGTQLREVESGFRYTPTTTFETFPLPHPTAEQNQAIAVAAKELDRLRQGWLNPAGVASEDLGLRTLTNLYNAPPGWLRQVHDLLNEAVHAAYGWPYPLADAEILSRLLELNLASRVGGRQASVEAQ
jgi:type II restriction/modification system DNA methylase subunit YeeA